MNTLDLSKIFNFLVKRNNLSLTELAEKIHVPRTTLSHIATGNTVDPRVSTVKAIADYFSISIDQLLGTQPLYLDEQQNTIASKYEAIPILTLDKVNKWESYTKLNMSTDQEWLMKDPSIKKGKFAVRNTGNSMWPAFQENALLIIDPIKTPKDKDYVIFNTGEDIKIRQLIVDGKTAILIAANQIFEPIRFPDLNNIVGVAIQYRLDYA
ncbi:MAG: putative HTH-type transcriptional regulator [Legionellaceae bacterium]